MPKWPLSLFILALACQSPLPAKQEIGGDKILPAAAAKNPNSFDGTYVFDTEAYKVEQLRQDADAYKNLSQEDIDKMMRIFKPYRIEIEGDTAKASFAHDVITGKIRADTNSASETELKFMPQDKPTLTFIIRGNSLVLDPGKKDSDKMFFKREL